MKQFRTYLALAAAAGFIFLGLWALLAVARYGSCASGGVYVSARQCAPGTGFRILELIVSIFGTIIATAVAASGGPRVIWAICTLVSGMLASYFFVIAFGPSMVAAGETPTQTPSLITAIVFTLIALPGVIGAVKPRRRGDPDADVFVDGPTGLTHVRSPAAGGPAAVVRAARRG